MCRLPDAFDAAALIDRAVDDHRARSHRRNDLLGHEHRCPAARHQDGSDDEIGFRQQPRDRGTRARDGDDPAPVYLVDPSQLVDVPVEHQHFGFHALRDPRRAPTDRSGSQHHDPSGPDPGRATQQHAAPALAAFEEMGADLGSHASGHFTHRHQEREIPVGVLHRLVTDADDLGVEQRACDPGVGREVQVREQHEARTQVPELVRLRLLHLEHDLGALHTSSAVGRISAPASRYVVVGDPGARPAHPTRSRPGRRDDVISDDAVGSDRDPMLVGLHFAGNTDDAGAAGNRHCECSSGPVRTSRSNGAAPHTTRPCVPAIRAVRPCPDHGPMPFDTYVDQTKQLPRLEWRRTEVFGRTASYGVGGTGPPIVFLHGWGLSGRTYRAALKRLLAQGFRVWAPALPGFDGSRALAEGAGDLAQYAAWVNEFLAAVGVIEPVVMMGHSFGGGIAIQTAHDWPERVRGLVLINSIGGSAWRRDGSIVKSVAQRPLWDWGLHFPTDILPLRQLRRVLPVILEAAVPNALRDPRNFWHAATIARVRGSHRRAPGAQSQTASGRRALGIPGRARDAAHHSTPCASTSAIRWQ